MKKPKDSESASHKHLRRINGAREMDHAEEVLQRVFPPYSEAAEVLEPGKKTLHLPTPP
jgi:hypothetical protein